MARQLSSRGESVALAARRTERLEALARELKPNPGRTTVHTLDVTNPVAVDQVIHAADVDHGGLDVVVINAGGGGGGRVGSGRESENRVVIDTNLLGALSQAENAMALFRERGHGHLVLVSSLAARRGLPGSAATYSAAKAAVASLGESLHIECAGSDIHVTTLMPGYIRTDTNRAARFPYMTRLERGVEAMIGAMDVRAVQAVVPGWPWRPLGWLLGAIPGKVIRRFF